MEKITDTRVKNIGAKCTFYLFHPSNGGLQIIDCLICICIGCAFTVQRSARHQNTQKFIYISNIFENTFYKISLNFPSTLYKSASKFSHFVEGLSCMLPTILKYFLVISGILLKILSKFSLRFPKLFKIFLKFFAVFLIIPSNFRPY